MTLSKATDNGEKKVSKKMNLHSFKLNHIDLEPLNVSNVGDFSWRCILKNFIQVQKDEGKFIVIHPRPP